MPPRQKKHAAVRPDNALTYWIESTTALRDQASREGALNRSYTGGELIRDAHHWGEAMVRAHLDCMTDEGKSAFDRLNMLRSKGKEWYARGYRFYLLPQSADAPKIIAKHVCYNEHVFNVCPPPSEATLRLHVLCRAADAWWDRYSAGIQAAAQMAHEAEREEAKKRSAPAEPAVPVNRIAKRPKPSPIASPPACATPVTVTATQPSSLVLPKCLARLLADPTTLVPSTPRPGIRQLVEAAFVNQRIARVWTDNDGVRRLTFLSMRCDELCSELSARGLATVYGQGRSKELKVNEETLQNAGLSMRGKGGFNSIWTVKSAAGPKAPSWVNEVLPPEVAADFMRGRLVLRSPHEHEDAQSFNEAVGEATNMLFTALTTCGPLVGALAFSHRVSISGRHNKYRIFTFLEAAAHSVDQRYTSTLLRVSASENRPYLDALVTTIFQMSAQGFVHLDATLRNFVDFYTPNLPSAITRPRIKVIDVEARCFRRVCASTQPSTDWRYLFLFNLLVVLVFLKSRIIGAWKPSVHWAHLRPLCKQLISELPGKTNVAAILMWKGAYKDTDEFPDLTKGKYAGETHEVVMRAAECMLRYYLLQQPLNEGTKRYVEILQPDPNDPRKRRDPKQLDEAKTWFANIYLKHLVPVREFFLRKLACWGKPQRFVEVAFEFLDTPLVELQKQCVGTVPPMSDHHDGCSRAFLLGIK
tara:strand:+ start:303 stop:2402 length:2100 start_codon:yes stop_codon:yes gene_type:complete